MVPQAGESLVVEPARMPELERDSPLTAQQAQEGFESRQILLEVRRQLKQQRPQFSFQNRRAPQEAPRFPAGILQSPAMRDGLRRLERKLKSARHLAGP